MLTLRNGYCFRFAASAGALGFAGQGEGLPWLSRQRRRFAAARGRIPYDRLLVVTKTVTSSPRVGNYNAWMPWRTIRRYGDWMVNAVGLTNPGLEAWLNRYYPLVCDRGLNVAVSIAPEDVADACAIAELLTFQVSPDVVRAIEVNLSCGNVCRNAIWDTEDGVIDLARSLRSILGDQFGLILKFGPQHDSALLTALVGEEIDAVALTNSLPWSLARDIGVVSGRSPLPMGGSVSGTRLSAVSLASLCEHIRQGSHVPVVAGGGITTADAARLRFLEGAAAISWWTAFEIDPALPGRIIAELETP